MKTLLLFFAITAATCLTAQNLTLNWVRAQSTYTLSNMIGEKVITDAAGSVYAIGKFMGIVDFDPGPGTTTLQSGVQEDGYIVKLDSGGTFQWCAGFGGKGYDYVNGININPSGDVLITGAFQFTVDFDPGPGTTTLSTNNGGAFACKLSSNGSFIWVKQMATIGAGKTVVTDANGNIFVSGYFDYSDLDPGPGTYSANSLGGGDIFVTKLDAAGNFQWAKTFGGPHYEQPYCMSLDNAGNIILGGVFRNTVDFDPGAGTYTLAAASANFDDAFLMKLDGSGNFLWANSFGAATNDAVDALVIDASNNIYITGFFQHIVDFDPGPATYTLTNPGNFATMICKYDPQGALVWGVSNSGPNTGQLILGTGIALDANNRLVISGRIGMQNVDFDPGPGTFPLSSIGGEDMYLQVLTTSGTFITAGVMGGTGTEYLMDVKYDGKGSFYTTGLFNNTADFQPGAGTYTITTGTPQLSFGFIQKIYMSCALPAAPVITNTITTFCKGANAALNATGTGTITWFNTSTGGASVGTGNTFNAPTANTGTFSFYAQDNTCGASPRAGITVNVQEPNVTVTSAAPSICPSENTVLQAGGATTYTWFNSANTSSVNVSPAVTTTYSVTGKDNSGCTASKVFTVTVINCTGLSENKIGSVFTIYPNPSTGTIIIDSDITPYGDIIIYSLNGQVIFSGKIDGQKTILNTSTLPAGVYIVRVTNENSVDQQRLIIE